MVSTRFFITGIVIAIVVSSVISINFSYLLFLQESKGEQESIDFTFDEPTTCRDICDDMLILGKEVRQKSETFGGIVTDYYLFLDMVKNSDIQYVLFWQGFFSISPTNKTHCTLRERASFMIFYEGQFISFRRGWTIGMYPKSERQKSYDGEITSYMGSLAQEIERRKIMED